MAHTDFEIDKEKLEIRMSRIFEANADMLWQAHTDPRLIPEWWGPRGYTTKVEKMDVKEGGEWRFVQKDSKGETYGFFGVFKELKKPNLITWTFNYEPVGMEHESVDTVMFEEMEDGRTRVSSVSRMNSLEDLSGMTDTGMENGAKETWDRLQELCDNMKQTQQYMGR